MCGRPTRNSLGSHICSGSPPAAVQATSMSVLFTFTDFTAIKLMSGNLIALPVFLIFGLLGSLVDLDITLIFLYELVQNSTVASYCSPGIVI